MKDRLNQVTQYSWCGCGGLASITDPLGHVTSWNRDLEGRVAQKTYFDGTTTYYTYYDSLSGRLKSVTDAKGQSKNYAYNADDTITNVTYTSAVISTPSVSFTYDPNYQRIISMADGSGQTTYSYNPITGSPSPGAGRLATEIGTFAGYTNTFAYDELGRMTNRAINGVSEGMAFDALGRVTRHNNALGVFTPVYLTPGSVASYRVGKFIYPNGQTNVYTYDNAAGDQRLLEILNQGPSGNISKFDYQYDVLSRITQWTQQTNAATAQVMELEYDPEGQLLNAAIAPQSQPAAKAYTYGYDAAGNRTSEQVDVAGSGAVSTATMSAYNEVNQLTNRTGAGALPVRFTGTVNEPAGVTVNGQTAATTPGAGNSQIFKGYANLSTGSQTVPVMASDYNGNVTTSNYSLTVSGGVGKAFAYDQNGNCTNVSMTGTNTSYEWDAEDRLVAVNAYSTNSATLFRSEFTYDGFDRRVQIVEKTNGVTASTKRFVWDGARLGEERSTNNAVTKRFFGEGEQINGTNYFFTFDHLGSVRELVDGSGVTRGRWNYDPYGRRSANQITSSPVEADFGFTGYYVHQASGLQLALYRAYDADRGTFINRDPIEEDGGLNLYDYVANNPINEIDPLGLWGFYRWLYTGNGNASDEVYDAATEAAGDYVYDSGGVRGGYLGVGYNGKGQGQYAPAGQVGLTGTWTVDDGASLSIDAGVGLQQRGRNSLGQFTSQTFGLGGGDEIWNENNDPCKKGAKFSGIYGGTANKNGGVNFGISGSDSVALGINYGPVYGGIIIDPSRVAGNFRDSFNLLFGH